MSRYEDDLNILSGLIIGKQEIHNFKNNFKSGSITPYQRNLYVSIFEVLSDYYPKLFKLLGDTQFKGLVRAYLESFGISVWSLNEYGQSFFGHIEHPQKTIQNFLKGVAFLDFLTRHPLAPNSGTKEINLSSVQFFFEDESLPMPDEAEINLDCINIKWHRSPNNELELSVV
jgi:hypothetical protein